MANPFDDFFSYEPRKDLESFSKVPTETWLKLGEQKALETFHLAAEKVPAYKDFLKKNKVNPAKIKTIEDFKYVPLTTKENYFRKYLLKDLSVGGTLSTATVFHVSSGSTGKSTYWPKLPIQDINAAKGVELLYTYYFDIDKVNTLQINCFGMGPWAAGETMHSAVKMLAEKGLKISCISPGLHEELAFNFFEDLVNNYDQILLAGYPSFLRNLVEEGLRRKIDFKKYKIKIFTGGESFSENWRDFMAKNLGLAKPYRDIASVLGTSEAGVVTISTPFVDSFRIYLYKNGEDIIKKFFPRGDLPSITQFIPPSRYIEIVKDEIVITFQGQVPLIKYDTKDYGKIIFPSEILSTLPKFKKDYESLKEYYGIPNLPVLTINGRADGTITLYALNIYPEQICQIVEKPKVQRYLTGRVVMEKLESEKLNPYLKLTLELKPNIKSSINLNKQIQNVICKELTDLNHEYGHLFEMYGAKVKPVIELKDYGCSEITLKSGKGVVTRRMK